MSSILIVPVGASGESATPALFERLQRTFHMPASIRHGPPLDAQFALDTFRNQYNSTMLLESLLERHGTHEGKVVGITADDLFVPVLTFVFGEAQLDGRAAVVSTHRLMEEFYGMDPAPEREEERIAKEVIHELGHTFGLFHCHEPECVMRSSTAVEEIDLKGAEFCERCREKLRGTT